MESVAIQRNIQSLDNGAKRLGQIISNMHNQVQNYRRQAYSFKLQAQELETAACYEEDFDRSYEMRTQSSEFFAEADSLEEQANLIESEMGGYKEELRGYRGQYQYYHDMGVTNLAELNVAVQKLSSLTSASYGRDKIVQALQAARQRTNFNQSLVKACQDRIAWIDRVCGSGGSQDVKVLRRR